MRKLLVPLISVTFYSLNMFQIKEVRRKLEADKEQNNEIFNSRLEKLIN